MNAWHIALKDVQIYLKDRGNLVNLFVLPLVFILVLSTSMQSFMGEGQDAAVTLPVVNLDPDGEQAQTFIENLTEAGGVRVERYRQEEAQKQLEKLEIEFALTIPQDFSARVQAGEPTRLHLILHPDANQTNAESVTRVVTGVAQEIALQNQLIASLRQLGDMQATSSGAAQFFSTERIVAQATSQFERAQDDPLVTVVQTSPQSLGQQIEEPNAVEQNVPGYAIIFVFLSAQATAFSIYQEKRLGSFRRLLAAPISKAELLIGKMMPNFVIGLTQIVIIFGVSILLLPLLGLDRLTLGDDPLALALVSLVLALCSTGLGIFIASIARSEAQIGGMSALALWTMGAVGGCLFPPFLLGGFLDVVGKVVPHYWAIQAYQDLIVRGRTLADVTAEILVLLGFSLAFFLIGLGQFEFD